MSVSSSRPRQLQPGLTAPLLLLVALLVDLASRFISYDHVSFRAWEAVQRFGSTGLGGPFQPNGKYFNDRAYGDLSSLGNYPGLRQYRREEFTTDAFGFRNPPRSGDQSYTAMVVGTSFTAGSSLSDHETLSVRLEQLLGQAVYNAYGLDPADERQLGSLLERLGLRNGTLIVEHVDSAQAPQPGLLKPARADVLRDVLAARLGARTYRDVGVAYGQVRGWMGESPLKLTLFRAFKSLENDTILPNSFRSAVVPSVLTNGDPILFQTKQVVPVQRRTPVEQAAQYWQVLASRLRVRGLNLLVVLVPTQYEVYGPLTTGGGADSGANGVAYLAALEQALRQRGLPVVNLTACFRAAAREGLASHRYIYWRDDTHWNAAGAALAAAEISAQLKVLAGPSVSH